LYVKAKRTDFPWSRKSVDWQKWDGRFQGEGKRESGSIWQQWNVEIPGELVVKELCQVPVFIR
jgi:hypothetical protein